MPKSSRSSNAKTPQKSNESKPAGPEPADGTQGGAPEEHKPVAFPIVGVGASAGGLDAFTLLMQHLPPDPGMSFVLVQHLDPTHDSLLSSLVAKVTKMRVMLVKDGMEVEPNCVYVIPPGTMLQLAGGSLRLSQREAGPNLPVDFFFRSLATTQRELAIGIILSGTASDGTEGVKAVKEAGGFTFAQDEASSQYFGMPRSAIATGCVDLILPPEGIAAELYRIGKHLANDIPPAPTELDQEDAQQEADQQLRNIFELLRKAARIDFTLYRQPMLQRRILRRMVLQRIDKLGRYVRFLNEHPDEVEALRDDLLINVTSFFRDGDTFAALKEHVFANIAANPSGDGPIRIWVPGCSTGEEAYSIAICVQEFLEEKGLNRPVQLFGTDLNEAAIEQARTGVYPESISAEVSAERLGRYFVPCERGYQICGSVRDMCIFAAHNVVKDPPFSKLDLVSCRNLLIYLGQTLQTKAVGMFHYALNAHGHLLLGSSETVGQLSEFFDVIDKKHRIYRKRGLAQPYALEIASLDRTVYGSERRPAGLDAGRGAIDLFVAADRALLSRFVPNGVLVDSEMNILQFRGYTGRYLEPAPGEPSLNLLRMAREEISLELRTAIHMVRKSGQPVRKEGMLVRYNGHEQVVNFEVIPFQTGGQNDIRYYVVIFEDASPKPGKSKTAVTPVQSTEAIEELKQLRVELDAARQYLQSTIEEHQATDEELKSANEEIQASNEELQSTNEELETAKEELQSTNEELTTVNEELQNRNQELTQLTNDLSNLLSSVNIPIVMLGSDFRIRRFTAASQKILSLIASDVGRPIMDITPKINVPDLEGMLAQVAATLTTTEREVQDREGHWYSMWIRPYRTSENRIDGAVMAFLDIDTVKRSRQEVREARSFAEAIVETVRHPLLVLDANLRVQTANRSFYETFGTTPEQTRNRVIYELGAGEWNTPTIRALLEDVSTREAPLQELEQDFERAGRKTMRISARRMVGSGPGNALFLLAFEDVTQRKEAAEARYRRLFESTKDGIILVDAESGRITDANPCAIDMLGTPRAELIGRRLWETAALEDSGTAELAFQELREHESVRYNDVNLKNLHGDTSVVDVMANVYSEAGRKVMQFNLRDVTMRKRAEETMRRSEEQLQNSVKMDAIGRLAGGVAHDFNNMLTTILGYADLLMTRMEPDNPYRGDIEEIHKSGQRAAALTRQLLAFGRRQVAQPKVVELNSVVSDVDNMLRKLLGENVELKMVLTPDLGHTRADGSQLQQVIVNLAMNARDAMPTGGKLRIETVNVDLDENRDNFYIPVRPGRYVMLAAADTGTGLTPDAREHLFEPFFTTKPKGMGTGLGLSTVYGIVKQSGGTIAVDTEEGKGTTMRLYFPRVDDPAESAAAKEVALPRRSAHERILLVEDDAAVRSLVHQILQREGYNVLVASDGHDALGILITQNPALDLLLTDVVMPGMSGRELADRVKETRPGLKVLFMSGHTEDAIVKQGVIDRGLDLLPKPFAPDVLTRKVREVLGE